jgi:[ribosomal protein S18]-alanine N-acetyltransferase
MTVKIIPATLEHLDQLVNLENDAFDTARYHILSRRSFRNLLTKGNADIYIAVQNSNISGAIIILYRKGSRFGRLYSLAVHHQFRGGGIGRTLFNHAEAVIRKKGLAGLLLETRSDNRKLLDFYLSTGCETIGELDHYYPDGLSAVKLKKVFGA